MPRVTFIHGLSNKPESHYLHDLWKRKLAQGDGLNLDTNSVSSRLVYWPDVLYPKPDEDLAAYENAGSEVLQDTEAKVSYDPMMSKLERYSHHYFFNVEFEPRPRKRGLAHGIRQLRS